ncbi:MAG: flavin prenyltransferase UbiX [Phycisphaeraceae bacterium]
MPSQRIVIGITGASGAVYARRVIQLLTAADCDVHLVVSPLGQRLLHDELGIEGVDSAALAALAGRGERRITLHHYRDVGASIASGSFQHDGMIVCPCSNNTLSAIAAGRSDNLLHRAANVTLKERRKLVLVHRETPLSLIELRNMTAVTEAGAIVCPANPGFYLMPRSIDDLVDFMAARVLDLVGVPHLLQVRWGSGSTFQPRAESGQPAKS